MSHNLDDLDWAVIDELQRDARLSMTELARRIHLGTTATTDRVRRLEALGVIAGYHARIDVTKVGLPVGAIVRLAYRGHHHEPMHQLLLERTEIVECVRVTGEDCYVLTIAAENTARLESVVDELGRYGTTTTSVIYSRTLPYRGITAYRSPLPATGP